MLLLVPSKGLFSDHSVLISIYILFPTSNVYSLAILLALKYVDDSTSTTVWY